MHLSSDQARDEQQRQTDMLTQAIRDLLREHASNEKYPMLGAAVSALAHNLGETIGQVDSGPNRKALRDASEKVRRKAERDAAKFGNIRTVQMTGKH